MGAGNKDILSSWYQHTGTAQNLANLWDAWLFATLSPDKYKNFMFLELLLKVTGFDLGSSSIYISLRFPSLLFLVNWKISRNSQRLFRAWASPWPTARMTSQKAGVQFSKRPNLLYSSERTCFGFSSSTLLMKSLFSRQPSQACKQKQFEVDRINGFRNKLRQGRPRW